MSILKCGANLPQYFEHFDLRHLLAYELLEELLAQVAAKEFLHNTYLFFHHKPFNAASNVWMAQVQLDLYALNDFISSFDLILGREISDSAALEGDVLFRSLGHTL